MTRGREVGEGVVAVFDTEEPGEAVSMTRTYEEVFSSIEAFHIIRPEIEAASTQSFGAGHLRSWLRHLLTLPVEWLHQCANAPPGNVGQMREHLPGSLHLTVEGSEHEDFFITSPRRDQLREVVLNYMKGAAPDTLRTKAPPITFIPLKE